jgi:hypothetical protein
MNILQQGMARARLSPLMGALLGVLFSSTSMAAYYACHAILSPLATDPAAKSEWRAPTALAVSAAVSVSDRTDTQTLTRPIFSKSRRPSTRDDQQGVAGAAPAPAAPLPSGLGLKAIVVHGDAKSAFMVCDSFPDGKWMKAGETIQSWTISAIHTLHVVLKSGERSSQLTIDFSDKGFTQPDAPISKGFSDPVFIREPRGRRSENRTFDHVFATYQPRNGEHVDNVLSTERQI